MKCTIVFRDKDEIKQKLSEFLDTLVEVALEDDKITDEEQELIDVITNDLEDMETQLFQILELDLEDEEFEDLRNEIIQNVIYNATKKAKEDDKITKDESRLLSHLEDFATTGVISDE